MRIGLVLSRTPSYSETFLLSKIAGLQESGFELTLFAQHRASDFSACRVKLAPKVNKKNPLLMVYNGLAVILKCLVKPGRSLRFIRLESASGRSVFQILKNIYNNSHILGSRLDWLHFGFATIAIQSEHVAHVIGAKMSVSFRGYDLDVYPIKNPNCYELLFKRVDRVHAISEYILSRGYALGLSRQVPFQIITPAVDIEKFSPAANPDPGFGRNFVTVARLHPIKGLGHTIKALSILKNEGVNFEYLVIGDGPEQDNLTTRIEELNLTNHVTLAGRMEHDTVIETLRSCGIYIQFSESEGFCNAVLEAQALGLLCVVSDGGALPENVVHKRTGWVVPKGNHRALADVLKMVLSLPHGKRSEIRTEARNRVIEDFNLKKQHREFMEFYNNQNLFESRSK